MQRTSPPRFIRLSYLLLRNRPRVSEVSQHAFSITMRAVLVDSAHEVSHISSSGCLFDEFRPVFQDGFELEHACEMAGAPGLFGLLLSAQEALPLHVRASPVVFGASRQPIRGLFRDQPFPPVGGRLLPQGVCLPACALPQNRGVGPRLGFLTGLPQTRQARLSTGCV